MMDILPDVSKAKEFVDKGANSSNQFIGSVASTLLTQFAAGIKNASVNTTGQAVNDIRYVLQQLNLRGYKAELQSGNVLAIRW